MAAFLLIQVLPGHRDRRGGPQVFAMFEERDDFPAIRVGHWRRQPGGMQALLPIGKCDRLIVHETGSPPRPELSFASVKINPAKLNSRKSEVEHQQLECLLPLTGLHHAKLNSVEVNILIGGRKMSTTEPPRFRLLAGSSWKKIAAGGALAVFGYSVWQVIALKSGDRTTAFLLLVSFGIIFALSLSDAFRHRRETREWMKSRSSH